MPEVEIKLVHVREDGTEQRVSWFWSCFNCGDEVPVDRQTYRMLDTKQLLGVRCDRCLNPPGKPGIAAA